MSTTVSSSENGRMDGRDGWIVVVSAFFIGFIADGVMFSFGILLVELLEHFQRGRTETVLIVSIMTGVRYLVGPFVGAFCDRYGYRVVVVIGAMISCVGFFVSAFATSVLYLCMSYGVLSGLGLGLMYIPTLMCVIPHFDKRRALANGIAMCGSGVGMFALNQLTRWLIDTYGWRGALMMEAGITLQGAVLGLFLLPPNQKKTPERDEIDSCGHDLSRRVRESYEDVTHEGNTESGCIESTAIETEISQGRPTESTEQLRMHQRVTSAGMIRNICSIIFNFDLLKDCRFWLLLMTIFVVQLAFPIPIDLLPDQVNQIGMSKHQAAWLTSSIGISNTVCRVCIGWVCDFKFVNRLIVQVVILILAGLSTGLSIFLTSFELKMIYTCFYGFLVGGYIILCPVVLADLFGANTLAKSLGLFVFSFGVAGLIASPIGGIFTSNQQNFCKGESRSGIIINSTISPGLTRNTAIMNTSTLQTVPGALFDSTGNYDVTFIIAGAEYILAGIILLLLKIFLNKLANTYLIYFGSLQQAVEYDCFNSEPSKY